MNTHNLRLVIIFLAPAFLCSLSASQPQKVHAPPAQQRPTMATPQIKSPQVTPVSAGRGGWVLRNETPLPAIPPGSEVLLFVHGMDSRAEEADDITKALFSIVGTSPRMPVPPALPPIAANRNTFQFTSCSNPAGGCPETCDHPDAVVNGQRTAVVPSDIVNGAQTRIYFEPIVPPALLDTPARGGSQINVPAAHNIGMNEGRLRPELRAAAAAAQPLESLKQATFKFAATPADAVMGNAFADLSVTGRRSFAAFRQAPPQDAFCQSLIAQKPANLSATAVLNGCHTALDRAYRVANFLRTGQRGDTPALKVAKTNERNALGYIAVSGEDDSPHRPVNVPSSDYAQYDLAVPVDAPLMGRVATNSIVVRTRYTVAQSQQPGRNLVVISVDLPSSGYADNLDYRGISPLEMIGAPKSGNTDFAATGMTPLLDFVELFIVRFVTTLDQKVPFKNDIKAVMGGSLGGNMTFRLGRRSDTPWFPKFVVWSPASIWDSLGGGMDVLKHQGPLHAWQNANQAMNAPAAGDRAGFFATWDQAIVPFIIPMAQSDTWTSDYYACKKSSVAAARLDRHETYDHFFLAWHWRLGAEQLLFSQQNLDPASHQPLYSLNHKPMLLGCGTEDHVPYNDICPATQNTAAHMLTPGKALFLEKTGHSLDNERRMFWAQQVVAFLGL